jgi:hypothetical protein
MLDEEAVTIPPDPEGMNDKRALWAEMALSTFRATTGAEQEGNQDIGDLLANIMHACDRRGASFDDLLIVALSHYSSETVE